MFRCREHLQWSRKRQEPPKLATRQVQLNRPTCPRRRICPNRPRQRLFLVRPWTSLQIRMSRARRRRSLHRIFSLARAKRRRPRRAWHPSKPTRAYPRQSLSVQLLRGLLFRTKQRHRCLKTRPSLLPRTPPGRMRLPLLLNALRRLSRLPPVLRSRRPTLFLPLIRLPHLPIALRMRISIRATRIGTTTRIWMRPCSLRRAGRKPLIWMTVRRWTTLRDPTAMCVTVFAGFSAPTVSNMECGTSATARQRSRSVLRCTKHWTASARWSRRFKPSMLCLGRRTWPPPPM